MPLEISANHMGDFWQHFHHGTPPQVQTKVVNQFLCEGLSSYHVVHALHDQKRTLSTLKIRKAPWFKAILVILGSHILHSMAFFISYVVLFFLIFVAEIFAHKLPGSSGRESGWKVNFPRIQMNLRFCCWKASIFIEKLMVSSWFLHLIHVIYLGFFLCVRGCLRAHGFGGLKKKTPIKWRSFHDDSCAPPLVCPQRNFRTSCLAYYLPEI